MGNIKITKMRIKNSYRVLFILFILCLLFLKTDFRLKNEILCCSDDYAYWLHAQTIAIDLDFDYSNQNVGSWKYTKFNKNTPIGFIGTGFLSAPFLFLGSILNNLIENSSNILYNFKILLYSFAPIFYYFFSISLIFSSLKKLNIHTQKIYLLIIFSGSGLTYFAFERYSMSHVYEVFTISLLIYSTIKFYLNENKNFSIFLIMLSLFLSYITRMSNVFIFLIPLIIKNILKDKNIASQKSLLKEKYFYFNFFLYFFIFYKLQRALYGKLIFNPQEIYGSNIEVASSMLENNLIDSIISLIKSFFIIFFSFEFGLLWVSPIIFLGFFCIFLVNKKLSNFTKFLFLICYFQLLGIVHIWQTQASSYGFRYLFALTPLSIILFYLCFEKNKIVKNILLSLSIFSNIAILFFETTPMTQLSLSPQMNLFGKTIRYVEPDYVLGVIKSLINIESYLIVFSTSFLGLIFFKIAILILGTNGFINLLDNFKLPIENEDFLLLLSKTEIISSYKLLLSCVLLIFPIYFYLNWDRSK